MKNKKDSYYYSAEEWSRSIGYGEVPPERLRPTPEDSESFDRTASHMAGEYVSYEDEITTHEKQQEWLKNVRKTKY
jgi:hypothetical protein